MGRRKKWTDRQLREATRGAKNPNEVIERLGLNTRNLDWIRGHIKRINEKILKPDHNIAETVKDSFSIAEVCKKLNLSRTSPKARSDILRCDTSHFFRTIYPKERVFINHNNILPSQLKTLYEIALRYLKYDPKHYKLTTKDRDPYNMEINNIRVIRK